VAQHPLLSPSAVVDSRLLLVLSILLFTPTFGSLVYASLGIRPDISYAVTTVSHVFSGTHSDAIYRYLLSTKDLKLVMRTDDIAVSRYAI